jgi:GNAT superfamily N-acetyltransferase
MTAAAVSDVSRSLPALVAALGDDPFYESISTDFAADAERRLAVLSDYFHYSLAEARCIGHCVLGSPPEHGATAWLLPAAQDVQAAAFAAKLRFLRDVLGPVGYANYERIIDFMSPRAERVVPSDAWYLSIVGVSPAQQRQGIGARLLAPTLAQAREVRAPCYLETFSPGNVAFYERLGFRGMASHDEPTTGCQYLVMLRDATAMSR